MEFGQQVGVPIYVAKILTYPERVHPSNKAWLQKLVENGPDTHPGANYVEKQGDENNKISLKYAKRKQAARDLRVSTRFLGGFAQVGILSTRCWLAGRRRSGEASLRRRYRPI